ncbi:MAG: DUF481 domain-containing protein [Deltaproteobacteria bacterium]|nr:DUF481 domain-containing protein [Deltaproteobacteria bacterium]NND27746.1 DUF481 domain-containing protein [Myxococcales bacterium]NNK07083.1 DUF481 domain-containing protein [Myxococcales bacterium]
MKETSANRARRAVWTASLALLVIVSWSRSAAAEEPQAEETAPPAAASSEASAADLPGETAPMDLVVVPAGVPAEPMDANIAIDSVKASMAKIQRQAASGFGETYVIPFGDTLDWLQLVSGEWVKGNVDRMRGEKMEFDSDKLDMLNLDFADVALVHSPQVNTYVFDDRVSATGPAVITGEQVIVQTDEGTKTFARAELESIIEGEKERDWWSMKLRFGLTLNRGNTDQLTYDIKFNTRREDRLTLLDLNYNATFGRTNGVQNVNRQLGEFLFNVFLGGRWWVTPAFGQLFNDRFQNIKFRATPAAGAGVHIFDMPKVKWDFITGIGYQYLNALAPVAGTKNPQNDAFIPLYTYWDFDITGDIDFTVSWLTNLVVTTIGNTNHTGKADLSVELTSVIDLDLAFLYLRTEQPLQPADPALPPIEKNDYQLVVGISLELG